MRVVPRAAFVEKPWRNGGGVSWEALAQPEGEWMLNLAEIARDGPFSDWSGYDRTLTVVRGEGLSLNDSRLTREPFSFDGGLPVVARLAAGPVLVFNLLARQGRWTHGVRRVAGPAALSGEFALALDRARLGGREVGPLDLVELDGPADAEGDWLEVALRAG